MRRKGLWRKVTGILMCAALILGDCPVWGETGGEVREERSGEAEPEEEKEPVYSMTLSETTFTYSGEEKCPGAVVYCDDEVLSEQAYEIFYTNNVNAGTASVTAQVDGQSVTQTFTILPKETQIQVNSCSKTYGDPDPDFSGSITGLIGSDSLGEVSYVRTEDSQKAGTVGLTAKVSDLNSNYSCGVTDGTLTILPRALTVASTLQAVTYGEALPSDVLSYVTVAGGSLAYGDTLSDIGLGYAWKTEGKDAGSHRMGLTLSGESADYTVSVQETDYTILPRTIDVSWPENTAFDFNGADQSYEPILSNFAYGESEIYPVLEGSTARDGGDHTCRITGLEGAEASNYILPENGLSGEWKILPVDLQMGLESVKKVYDGEEASLRISAEADPELLPEISTAYRKTGTDAWVEGSPEEAGTYDIKLVSEATENFLQTERLFNESVTIEKRPAAVRIPDARKAYSEADPVLEDGWFENGVEADVDLEAIDLQVVRIGEDEDPGVYEGVLDLTAEAKSAVEGLENYEAQIHAGSFTIHLSDALTVSAEDVQAVYDGEPHTVLPQACLEGAQILYYNDESGDYDRTEAPAAVNVAEGVLDVRFKASLFGYEDAYGSASVEILPADATVIAKGKTLTADYSGEEITVSGVDFENVPEGVEIRPAQGIEAAITEKDVMLENGEIGRYAMGLDENSFEISGESASNYNIQMEVTDGSLMILPVVPEFSLICEEKTYDGQPAKVQPQILLAQADADLEPVIRYSFTEDGEHYEEGLPVHAGTYTVKAVLDAVNGNYEGNEAQVICHITPMDVQVLAEVQDKIYDGKDDAVIFLSAEEIPGVCSLTFEGAAGHFADADAGSGKAVSLPEASVKLSGCAYGQPSDFKLILPEELTADITPRRAELVWSEDILPYNGQEQSVTAEVLNPADGDIVEIEYSGNTAVERGSYTAEAVGLLDPNYVLPEENTHAFAIIMGKASIRIEGTRLALDWNDEVQTAEGFGFTVSEGPQGAENEIFVSLKEGVTAIAEGLEVGDYYMGLTAGDFVIDSVNYEVQIAECVDGCLTICKANKAAELSAVRINGSVCEPDVLGAYTGKIGDHLEVEILEQTPDAFDLYSSDTGIAMPSENGGLDLVGYGEALITISVHETEKTLAQELAFHIRVGKVEGVVAFSAEEVQVTYLSETAVIPENTLQAASYTLTSLTPEICLVAGADGVPSSQASCSGTGSVYGRMAGEGSIEIRIPENERSMEAVRVVKVRVEKAERRVHFTEREVRMDPTAKAFSILPQCDGDETRIVFESSDPEAASITEEGLILPMGKETEGVQITAIYEENANYKEAQDAYTLILAHNWILKEEEHLDPTCTEKGYRGVYHCTNPGCVETRYETEIDALGHELVYKEALEATDSEPGMDAHYACTRCDALFADEEGKESVEEVNLIVNHVIVPVQEVEVYNGKKHRPKKIRAVAEGSTLVYSTDGETFTEKVPGFKDAGTYTVYVKAEHPAYRDSEVSRIVLNISEKLITVSGENLKADKIYDGNITAKVEGSLSAVGVLEGEEAEISFEQMEGSYDCAKPGKHTVTVCITGLGVSNPNYRLENDSITLQIDGRIRPAVTTKPNEGHGHEHGHGPGMNGSSDPSGSTGGNNAASESGNTTGTSGSASSGISTQNSGSAINTGSIGESGSAGTEDVHASGSAGNTGNAESTLSGNGGTSSAVSAPAAGSATPVPAEASAAPTKATATPTPTLTQAPEPSLTPAEEAKKEIGETEKAEETKAAEPTETEKEPEPEKSSLPVLPIGVGLAVLIVLILLLIRKKAG